MKTELSKKFAPTHMLIKDFRIAGMKVCELPPDSPEVMTFCRVTGTKRPKGRMFYTVGGKDIAYVARSYAKELAAVTPKEAYRTTDICLQGEWYFDTSVKVKLTDKEVTKRQNLMVCDFNGIWRTAASLNTAINICNKNVYGGVSHSADLYGVVVNDKEELVYLIGYEGRGISRLNYLGSRRDKQLATEPCSLVMLRNR